ncbi:MAG: SDR family NAD(P)-dependent oxidoreductase [Candidatus Flemingiibacterium sp.]
MSSNKRTALVTGAGMGIGRGIALTLAQNGYNVAIHYNSSEETALETVREAEKYGVKAAAIKASLSSKSGVDLLFDRFSAEFERLDLFVNNAGVTKTAAFDELVESDFDLMYGLDLKGSYYCIARAGQIMKTQGGGNIIVIASNNAHMNTPRAAAYASVKAGLVHLARHAAVELARYGIRVNTISPGWTDTGSPRLGKKEDTYYKIPLKRWCRPEEIGAAALFLDSQAAASITGAELIMDGGASLMSDMPERYGL